MRRFGKTIAGNMLSAYYSKGADSRKLFEPFKISQDPSFEAHLNKYNVLKLDINAMYSKWLCFEPKEKPAACLPWFFKLAFQKRRACSCNFAGLYHRYSSYYER
ncbi:MAG: AAA family ATPase [Treponema sp.]|nr:AAA family ATPase [Treponema sp.]